MCPFVAFSLGQVRHPTCVFMEPFHNVPLPMYARFSMSRRMVNQVPLPLLGSLPVDSPNLDVFVLPTALVRALVPVLFPLVATPNWPTPESFKQRSPSLCCASVVIIITCTPSLLLSPLTNLVCLSGPLLLLCDWGTALSEISKIDQPLVRIFLVLSDVEGRREREQRHRMYQLKIPKWSRTEGNKLRIKAILASMWGVHGSSCKEGTILNSFKRV